MTHEQSVAVSKAEDSSSTTGDEPSGEGASSRRHAVKVATSVVIFCLSVSVVPIVNKEVFKAGDGVRPFPCPVATAFLQLSLVAAVMAFGNVVERMVRGCSRSEERSWILGPHFKYKIRHVAPVGILFGLKYGVTNQGLLMVHTGTHLLLQSTDLIWTVALARLLNKERLGLLERGAAVLATVGSLLVGMQVGVSLSCPLPALLVNCCTPALMALCVSTLRSGAKELFNPSNRLHGSVTLMEFTALKLGCSAVVAFLLSILMEGGNGLFTYHKAWWLKLAHQSTSGLMMLFGGGVSVMIFQVNLVWLAGLTSATTVGMVGSFKVVPQYLMSALADQSVDTAPLHLAGASLVLIASMLYSGAMCMANQLELTLDGLRWLPRVQHAAVSPHQFQGGPACLREPLLP